MLTTWGRLTGLGTPVTEGSCDGYKEGMCVGYLAQCPPSHRWLENHAHDSDGMSALVRRG